MAGATATRLAERIGPAPTLAVAATILALAASFLGGASQENRPLLMALECLSLPVAALAVRRMLADGRTAALRWPLLLVAGLFAVPLLQSIPLPPDLWTRLGGQAPRAQALRLAGLPLGWRPLSLYPAATLAALPALFPPVAMFLAALQLDARQRATLVAPWIAAALVGLMLGLAQMTMPDGGPAYLYADTNVGSLVGLFANRNHEAALLLALLPLAVALTLRRGWLQGLGALLILIAVVALGADRSRAGIILAAPVTAGCAALIIRARGPQRRRADLAIFAAVVLASVLAVGLFAFTPILDRFDAETPPEFRYKAWPYIWHAALHHQPLGAGLGAFDRVYRALEPLALVKPAFFNHAHNDYLELFLETGWLGLAVLAAWAVWLARAGWRAWAGGGGGHLARGASLAILALAAMSAVDYPLRTEALATLLAFCCAALAGEATVRA